MVRNQKGQVALFVALIFQVLFVFFAMIVNVGLLVHHKINLQNSVDLAAYYGAMRQAEMMNAIGHVNYQIRQSWKLLTYRMQAFGTAGAVNTNPYKPGPPEQFINVSDIAHEEDTAFCSAYSPVTTVNSTENYCQSPGGITIPLPGVPVLGPANIFVTFQGAIAAAATALKNAAVKSCSSSMGGNIRQVAEFIGTYKIDARNRKRLLIGLANELSAEEPNDIDAASIKEGVFKTLYKNLTRQNQDSLKSKFRMDGSGSGSPQANFKFVNSLSLPGCGNEGGPDAPPKWLAEKFVFPVQRAVDANCTAAGSIQLRGENINIDPSAPPSANLIQLLAGDTRKAQEIMSFVYEAESADPKLQLYRTTAGFEKNPWCLAYIGVSATTTPKIPFTPLGDVTMKATAYAKPFGGRIGPWYSKFWDPDAATSRETTAQADMVDKILPIRVKPDQPITTFDPTTLTSEHRLTMNSSRYVGDQIGFLSKMTMGEFQKAIYKNQSISQGGLGIDLNWFGSGMQEDWDTKSGNGDPLAWNEINNSAPQIRTTEIAAVAPDQFDTTFYSIDPDFYNNYLSRIEAGYNGKFQFLLRGDLGSRMQGSIDEKRFSIRNQIETLKASSPNSVDWNGKLTYYLNEFAQVLTGWQQTTPDNYALDQTRFGKCEPGAEVQQSEDPKFYTMGSCKAGGRTGYSVKLVDGKFLSNVVNGSTKEYELGGPGVFGSVKNPPPSGF
jgi:hypothetical protein